MRTIFEAVRLIDGLADAPARMWMSSSMASGSSAVVRARDAAGADRRRARRRRVIDGRGRTLLPGLIDAHAHYTFDPTEGSIATIAAPLGRRDRAGRGRPCGARPCGPASRPPAARGRSATSRSSCATRSPPGRCPGRAWSSPARRSGSPAGTAIAFGLEADGPEAARSTPTRRVVRDGADVVKVVASEAAMLTTTGLAPGRMVHGAPELTEAELRAIVRDAPASSVSRS